MRTTSIREVALLLLISAVVLPLVAGCIDGSVSPSPEPVTKATETASTNMTTPSPSVTAQPDIWTEQVLKANLIVTGNITGLRYEVENLGGGGRRAYTVFTLTVDKVIKGTTGTREVFIRVQGGKIDDKIFEGPRGYYFEISDRVLVCLRAETDGIFSVLANGVLWWRGRVAYSLSDVRDVIARIVAIMRANNVPVALPESEMPPWPMGPVPAPKK